MKTVRKSKNTILIWPVASSRPTGKPGGIKSRLKKTNKSLETAKKKLLASIKKYAFDDKISDHQFREFIQNALYSHIID